MAANKPPPASKLTWCEPILITQDNRVVKLDRSKSKAVDALVRGVIYRIDFTVSLFTAKEDVSYIYCGHGSDSVYNRLNSHLKDDQLAKCKPRVGGLPNAQYAMCKCLQSSGGSLSIRLLSRDSFITVGDKIVTAKIYDKFSLMLFEAAALIEADDTKTQEQVILNSRGKHFMNSTSPPL